MQFFIGFLLGSALFYWVGRTSCLAQILRMHKKLKTQVEDVLEITKESVRLRYLVNEYVHKFDVLNAQLDAYKKAMRK